MTEQIEIDGEGWEISEEETIWIGHGTEPQNRGCIVSAYSRQDLIEGIPQARERHRMASIALGMERAILTAFKDVITSNRLDGYKKAEDYAERQEKLRQIEAMCAELWPWVFATASPSETPPA